MENSLDCNDANPSITLPLWFLDSDGDGVVDSSTRFTDTYNSDGNYLSDSYEEDNNGDGVIDLDINKLVKYHKSHGKIITITGVYPPARFGEIIEQNGKVISFEEKPQTSSGLINGGYMVFNKKKVINKKL